MQKKLKFVILTNISSAIGYGHYNRCLILAKKLKYKNKVSLHIIAKKDIQLFQKEKWIKIHHNKTYSLPKADVCIVDTYNYNNNFYSDLKKKFRRIIIFDDNKFIIPKNVTGVINPNIDINERVYPTNIKTWCGSQYTLLREEFSKKIKSQRNSVFLCIGGSDPTKQMNRLVSLLKKNSKYSIDAVFGHGYPKKNIIRKWKKDSKINIYHGSNKISKIMSRAKYALSSSGSIVYELIALKIPIISISLAKNQIGLGQALSKHKSIDYLGFYKNVTNKMIAKAILKKEKLNRNFIVDNKIKIKTDGARKLAEDLTSYFDYLKKNTPQIFTIDQVKNEYKIEKKNLPEYKKLRWGSKKTMENRYIFFLKSVPFQNIQCWLDVGSGTGLMQKLVQKKYKNILATGVEISKSLIEKAIERNVPNTKFINKDYMKIENLKFDLISSVGVLSKTNFNFISFLKKSSDLLTKDGILFFDFKNINWKKLNNKRFFPDFRHSWASKKQISEVFRVNSKFKNIQFIGYDPKSNKIVELNNTHTIYVLCKRK